jgi:hypothetical protein
MFLWTPNIDRPFIKFFLQLYTVNENVKFRDERLKKGYEEIKIEN